MMFQILSFYKISKLNKLKIIKKNILKETNKLDIKGLIILSPEGINGTISGSHKKIKLTITKIKNILSIDRFDIQNKFNSKILPYSKNKVKIKNEVVPINEKINFKNFFNKKYLSPKKWDEFISKKNIKLIDARKPFEYKIGTFKNALNPETKNFRDFKNYLSKFNKDEYEKINYIRPIIDIPNSTKTAKKKIKEITKKDGYWDISKEIFLKHGSRKRLRKNINNKKIVSNEKSTK